jgi:hypothetical protein
MNYKPKFELDFMSRSRKIIEEYQGPYDATLLINCMLGLLVVPKETLFSDIPLIPFESLTDWGIKPGSILEMGKCNDRHEHLPNLRQLVLRMRNAVAHFRIKPFPMKGQVQGFEFSDSNGFKVKLELPELREFIIKLSEYLESKTLNKV